MITSKKKVLIIERTVVLYRVPIWNAIAENFDLTIGFFEGGIPDSANYRFKQKKFGYKKIGPFIIVLHLREYLKKFDAVCFMPDPHVLSYVSLPFLPHKYKLLTWSIGFRCSYIHPYLVNRKHTMMDKFYQLVFNKVDANVFYMKKALLFWRDADLNKDKIFIAPNTTGVATIDIKPELKKNFLFVGSLYKGKGVDLLIKAFKEAIEKTQADVKLIIVGKGEMKDSLEQYVKANGLEDKVIFTGAIYDEKQLATYFQKSLLCISPTQGGLSCPKSMGYGVPFVCRKDAITGGEIYHMTNGLNGIMYDEDTDLVDILVDSIEKPQKYIEMGILAKQYYDSSATPTCAANGVISAINSVIINK